MKENVFKLTEERSRRYPAQKITDTDYTDDILLLANTSAQAETLPHSLEGVAVDIGFHVNAGKTEYMCFNQRGDISTLNPCRMVELFSENLQNRGYVQTSESIIYKKQAKLDQQLCVHIYPTPLLGQDMT